MSYGLKETEFIAAFALFNLGFGLQYLCLIGKNVVTNSIDVRGATSASAENMSLGLGAPVR